MVEKFVGVKFSIEVEDGEMETENAALLIEWCRAFHRMGLATPSGEIAGNISVRTKHGFLITPSGNDFSKISIEELVEVIAVDDERRVIKAIGSVEPSSESFLHAGIYSARSDVNAVLHGHNPAVTENPEKFRLLETKAEKPYGTVALRNEVLRVLGENSLLQMKGHGFIALGSNLSEAGKRAESLYRESVK